MHVRWASDKGLCFFIFSTMYVSEITSPLPELGDSASGQSCNITNNPILTLL